MLKAFASLSRQASLLAVLGATLALNPAGAFTRGSAQSDALGRVSLAQLPAQGRTTYALILKGGPFPFEKDGTVFGNRERILPAQKRGYYREYTVKTPGSSHRGARRIVCGGQQIQIPDACFYTGDHYASFREIVE